MFTFMSEGKHRVERIPREWVEDVRQRVEAGREFQSAVREVLTANAELLILSRKQRPNDGDEDPQTHRLHRYVYSMLAAETLSGNS